MAKGYRSFKQKYINKKHISPNNKSIDIYFSSEKILTVSKNSIFNKNRIYVVNYKASTKEQMLKQSRKQQYYLKAYLKRTHKKLILYQRLLIIYQDTNQQAKTLSILKECLQQFVNPYWQFLFNHQLGNAYFYWLRYDQAAINYQKSIEIYANSFNQNDINQLNYEMLKDIFNFTGNYSKAAFIYKQCKKITPQTYTKKMDLSKIYLQQQSVQQFNVLYGSSQFLFYQKMAKQYLQMFKLSQAILFCLKAIQISPFRFNFYKILGAAYGMKQDYCQSYYYYEKAIELNSFSEESLNGMGMLETGLNHFECAIYYFVQSIKLDPSYQDPFVMLTIIYDKEQDQRQSIVQQLQALEKNNNHFSENFQIAFKLMGQPSNYYLHFNYITQIIQEDILPENSFVLTAISFFQLFQSLSFEPPSRQYILNMGLLYKLVNNEKKATEFYQKLMYQKQKHHKNNRKDQYQLFLKIYDYISKINDDHYRVLVCYFLISQIFKENESQALKSVKWLLIKQPSAQCQPLFTQIINKYENTSVQQVFFACQFANKLLSQLDNEDTDIILQCLMRKTSEINQKTFFSTKIRDSLLKCKNHSKKYINFMLHLKGEKICFQLNKLISFSTSEGIRLSNQHQTKIYSQIFSKSNHGEFLRQFQALTLKSKQQKIKLAQIYAFKCVIRLQLATFICNLLGHYFQFRRSKFEILLREVTENQTFNFSLLKQSVQKYLNNSQGQNSRMGTFTFGQRKTSSYQSSYSGIISQMDSSLLDEPLDREDRYYKTINLQNFQFQQPSLIYLEFKTLLLKNSYLLPQYLTYNNKKSNHIIKYFVKQCWNKDKHQNGFRISMEKGEQIKKELICRSKDKIYAWILSIAQSIIDIQSMGMFNADIQYRNTVAIEGIFKMIDFGLTFKFKLVEGQTKNLSIYLNTVNMIEESLGLAFDQNYAPIETLFGNIQDSDDHKQKIKKIVQRLQVLEKKQIIIKCIDQLWNNAKHWHLRSYCKLVYGLLESAKQVGNVLGESQLKEIFCSLQMLKQKKVSYEKFLKNVKVIKEAA